MVGEGVSLGHTNHQNVWTVGGGVVKCHVGFPTKDNSAIHSRCILIGYMQWKPSENSHPKSPWMILLVSTKHWDLWLALTLEVCNSRTHIWEIWLAKHTNQVLYACSKNGLQPEVSMHNADHGLWGLEWCAFAMSFSCLSVEHHACSIIWVLY